MARFFHDQGVTMAKKRGTGEGTVFQRADGLWAGSISLGFDQQGKRIRKYVYGSTQKEVNEKLDELKQQRKHGTAAIVGKDTVAGFLNRWLADDVALNKAGKTHQEYEGTVRLYITPFIGSVKLNRLNGEMLISWQGKLARKGFSNNMRLRSIRILRNALNKAVKLRIIPFNPIAALDKPKVTRKDVRPLEPEQCHKLIAACTGHRLGDMITLAAMTGLRKGELFALHWDAVNLREGVLVVRRTLQELRGVSLKEPKTQAGKRVVTLGAEALKALQSRLTKALEEGFDPEQVPMVFPNNRGGYMRGSNFDRNVWYPIRKAADISDTFVFHDLRHTQASLMLAAGVDLKVIQKRLGHRDFATTANIYSHLLQGAENDAVLKVDALMSQRAEKVAEQPAE
jgi:integrase